MAEFPALRPVPPNSHRGTGYIYFMVADQNVVRPMVKIGFSLRAPEQRLSNCQEGSPVELRIVAVIHGRMCDERDLHRRFAHLRSHREWFFFGGELREFVEAMA